MSETGREHDARVAELTGNGDRRGDGADVAAVLEVFFFPELLEFFRVIGCQRRGIDGDDVVFHQREGVIGHVGRAGPDRCAVAHDEFVVH